MNLTRRQVLQLGPVLALAGTMAKLGSRVEITFEDIQFDHAILDRAIQPGRMRYDKEAGRAIMEVKIDTDMMWQAIQVIDNKGRAWSTDGKSLRYGDTVIELEEDATPQKQELEPSEQIEVHRVKKDQIGTFFEQAVARGDIIGAGPWYLLMATQYL